MVAAPMAKAPRNASESYLSTILYAWSAYAIAENQTKQVVLLI